MVDDQLFREVEEELRQERMKALWNKYGTMVVAAICGVILLVGGVIAWKNWQVSKRQAAGDQFIEAMRLSSKGKSDEALKLLDSLASDSPAGYEQLASLYSAGLHHEAGRMKEAEELYKKVAENPSADKILSEYAKLNMSMLQLDGASYEKVRDQLSSFIAPGAAWRGTALEAIALAALKNGKLDMAEKHFQQIIDDRSAPVSLRRRAQIMLDVISMRKAAG